MVAAANPSRYATSYIDPQTGYLKLVARDYNPQQVNSYDSYKGTPSWVPHGAIEKVSPSALEKTD